MNDELKALCGLLRGSISVQFTIPYECFGENSLINPTCKRVHDSLEYLKTDDTVKTLISSLDCHPNEDVIVIVEKKQTFEGE